MTWLPVTESDTVSLMVQADIMSGFQSLWLFGLLDGDAGPDGPERRIWKARPKQLDRIGVTALGWRARLADGMSRGEAGIIPVPSSVLQPSSSAMSFRWGQSGTPPLTRAVATAQQDHATPPFVIPPHRLQRPTIISNFSSTVACSRTGVLPGLSHLPWDCPDRHWTLTPLPPPPPHHSRIATVGDRV